MSTSSYKIRRLYLAAGALAMLFAGVIYAWSILKIPLAENFGWTAPQLALNFTFTLCFYCLGLLINGVLERFMGVRPTIIVGAILACLGFVLTGQISGEHIGALYISYSVISCTGIGIS